MNEHERMTDAQLLAESGPSPFVFDCLFRKYAPPLHRSMCARVGSEAVAMDLVAETFAEAWASRHRFVPPPDGSAAPWLFGIAANLYRKWMHSQRVEREARGALAMQVEWSNEMLGEDHLEVEEPREDVLAALQTIPPLQREAVHLRIIDELPYPVVASKTNCSAPTARVRVFRGLKKMSATLNGDKS